jgi:hypothetical protein
MSRSSHRAVTHGGWARHQPEPGYYVHRSPCGYIYMVTNQGTLALGRTDFSQAVWNAAQPVRDAAAAWSDFAERRSSAGLHAGLDEVARISN